MIIKKIFDDTFLTQPYYGGINSFSLVLMVSAYLKAFDGDKPSSLSRNLSGFFHFYGIGFNTSVLYLKGDTIEVWTDEQPRPFADSFIVLDPLDETKNICHSAFRIRDIQRALVKAFKIINTSCQQYQELSQPDIARMRCSPQEVLERLMTEIKQEHMVQQAYEDA